MKKTTLFLAVACLALLSFKPEVIERFGVKGPLTFGNKSFFLASTEVNGISYVQEYVPKGEDVGSFHEMVSIFVYDTKLTVDEAVKAKMTELEERKHTDPVCNYMVNESPDGKEKILDFLLSVGTESELSVVEFNAYRFKEINIDGRKAIMIYAYSKRAYKDEIRGFLTTLKDAREGYLNRMIAAELPEVKLIKK